MLHLGCACIVIQAIQVFGQALSQVLYSLQAVRRMSLATVRLYLLGFAYHRFRQINDNLIETFIHLVNQYEKQPSWERNRRCRELKYSPLSIGCHSISAQIG